LEEFRLLFWVVLYWQEKAVSTTGIYILKMLLRVPSYNMNSPSLHSEIFKQKEHGSMWETTHESGACFVSMQKTIFVPNEGL